MLRSKNTSLIVELKISFQCKVNTHLILHIECVILCQRRKKETNKPPATYLDGDGANGFGGLRKGALLSLHTPRILSSPEPTDSRGLLTLGGDGATGFGGLCEGALLSLHISYSIVCNPQVGL